MKIKNIKTKLKIAGLIAISALLPYLSSNLKAATHTLAKNSPEIEAVGIGETMDSTYAFSLKWTENSRIEHWGNYGKNILTTNGVSTYDTLMPTDDNLSGQIGSWIYNIGMYKGKTVDLKCTYYWNPLTVDGTKIPPIIAVTYRDDLIGFSFWNHSYEVKHELYSEGKPISVDMSLTFGDVDACQYFAFQSDNIDKIQCVEDCIIYYRHDGERRWIYAEDITKSNTPDCSLRFQLKNTHEFTILFGLPYDSYSYDFKSMDTHDDAYCYKYIKDKTSEYKTNFNNTPDGGYGTFISNHWGYVNGLAYGPYSIDTPIKNITDTNESNVTTNTLGENETFKYNIYQFVPLELSDYYYSSFTLKDSLPNCVEYISSKIYDDANKDVTNLFTISRSGQTIIATAKDTSSDSFYNTTYKWEVTVKLKTNTLNNFKIANNHYQFTNKANLTINRNSTITKETNLVTSNYYTQNLTINKIWKDNSNAQNLRPTSVNISIYQNNGLYLSETLNTSNSTEVNKWVKDVELPKYNVDGTEFIYSLNEDIIVLSNGESYVPTINGNTITNTLTKDLGLDITKIWNDQENFYLTRPESLNITILQNDVDFKTITLNASNIINNTTWKMIGVLVPKYDTNGVPYTYTIREDTNNPNLRYYYQTPIYNQQTLTVTNTTVWLRISPDNIPFYRISITKDIVNNNNLPATQQDFEKIGLNYNNIYKFPIVLKQLNRTLSKGETSMIETYSGYSGNEYHGLITKDNQLVFKDLPVGKYEIFENNVPYFDFVNIEKLYSSNGANLTYENGKYYITISGISTTGENISVKVTNKIKDYRPYDDSPSKENLFNLN